MIAAMFEPQNRLPGTLITFVHDIHISILQRALSILSYLSLSGCLRLPECARPSSPSPPSSMDPRVLDWYWEIPIVTRLYSTAIFAVTVLCAMDFMSPYQLYFSWRHIQRGEVRQQRLLCSSVSLIV